ncbi:MAG: M48 family metalloprotease [Arenimonas sp.]
MKNRNAVSHALFLALAFVLSSNSANAQAIYEDAKPGDRPASNTDEAELWYIIDRQEEYLRNSPFLVRDPALNEYVRNVACKVASDYCKDLRIYILDVPFFNASMAPNGVMIIWTGALLRMQNESDLALIMGHEFGHYKKRHSIQQWRKLKKSSAFLGTFGILTAGAGVGMAGMIANIAGGATMAKFSRDKEREADRIGMGIIGDQHYDPESSVRLWEAMLREENARDYGKPFPVFASHPQTKERVEDVRAAATAITNPGKELGRDAYRKVTRPFLQQWLQNELTRRMYNTSVQVIGDLRKTADPSDAGMYTFYLGEAYRQRNKNDDRAQATKLYAQAVTEAGSPAQAWRENGLALRDSKHYLDAIKNLQEYLTRDPGAPDRGFIESYLKQMETLK